MYLVTALLSFPPIKPFFKTPMQFVRPIQELEQKHQSPKYANINFAAKLHASDEYSLAKTAFVANKSGLNNALRVVQ